MKMELVRKPIRQSKVKSGKYKRWLFYNLSRFLEWASILICSVLSVLKFFAKMKDRSNHSPELDFV